MTLRTAASVALLALALGAVVILGGPEGAPVAHARVPPADVSHAATRAGGQPVDVDGGATGQEPSGQPVDADGGARGPEPSGQPRPDASQRTLDTVVWVGLLAALAVAVAVVVRVWRDVGVDPPLVDVDPPDPPDEPATGWR